MEKKKLRLLVCALAMGLTAGLANADIESGLTAYWPFQEGEGLITANEAGDNNDGTFINGPIWVDGLADLGKAIDFDGTDDYLDCESLIATSTRQLSLSIWVNYKREGLDLVRAVMVSNRNVWGDMLFDFLIRTYKHPEFGYLTSKLLMSQGVTGDWPNNWCYFLDEDGLGVTVPENVWTHIVVTCDGDASEATAYLNGEYISTGAFSLPPTGISHPTRIGWSTRVDTVPYPPYTLMQEQFCGSMDEVRIYDRILSEADIQQLYEFRTVPGFNSTPYVDAGDYQSILWPADSVQLAATVSDDGRPYQDPPADPCTPVGLTLTWSQLSGPGTVGFSDTTIADPTVTFPAAGYYDLQLRVFDGDKDACDVVGIYVKTDSTLPIAYWDFETGNGTNVVDRTLNNNFGTFSSVLEPNWVDGWIGDGAIEVREEGSHVVITVDPYADPNLDAQKYEITVSAWVKVNSWGTAENWNGIVTKGNGETASGAGGWSLLRNSSNNTLSFSVPGAGRVDGSLSVRDGYWHHIVGVHDGVTMSMYTDGLPDGSVQASGLLKPCAAEVWIGGNSEIEDNFFNGEIDDVRIYSYGMDLDGVQALAAMGALIPVVDAGEDQVFAIQDGFVQLDGTVTDDGKPEAATLVWSETSGPGDVVFSDTAIEGPTATFSEVGTYVLRLTANDTIAVIYDEVTITVESPICQNVIDDGLLITSDISGPEGIPDCYVDLYDVAEFASYWLRCNNPQDSECDFPY